MTKTLIVIAGPTAIGKTALAIRLAQHLHTEIISADSRQFYKELEIGTAKPSEAELLEVKHHFINSHSIRDNFSVGDYETEALQLIEDLFKEHDQLVLAGGSGLFIQAICQGFDDLPRARQDTRDLLNAELTEKGIKPLQDRLKAIDPVYYAEVDLNNPQRLIRALEVYETTGRAFSEYRTHSVKKRPFNIITIGLNTDRAKLYAQINSRVDTMIERGLVSEVQNLRSFQSLNPLNTVGYSEIFDYLEGKYSLEEAIENIKQNTRRFAKRQITWLKKIDDIKWFEPDDFERILQFLNSRGLKFYPERGEQKN